MLPHSLSEQRETGLGGHSPEPIAGDVVVGTLISPILGREPTGEHEDQLRQLGDLLIDHGIIDRRCPFKAEIAPAWRNWNPGYRIRHQSRTVQIQLSIFKPVGPPSLFGDHLDSDNIAIKAVGSFPIGHVDHAMIKPRRETHSR